MDTTIKSLHLFFIYYVRRGNLLWRKYERKPGLKKSRVEDFDKAKMSAPVVCFPNAYIFFH